MRPHRRATQRREALAHAGLRAVQGLDPVLGRQLRRDPGHGLPSTGGGSVRTQGNVKWSRSGDRGEATITKTETGDDGNVTCTSGYDFVGTRTSKK